MSANGSEFRDGDRGGCYICIVTAIIFGTMFSVMLGMICVMFV